MTLKRRKFTKLALLGGASFTVSSGIYFPKPARSYNLEINLTDATSRKVFGNILRNANVQNIGAKLPAGIDRGIAQQITSVEGEFQKRQFTEDKTDFGRTQPNSNTGIIWGQQKQETIVGTKSTLTVPNAGFATVQRIQGEVSTATFSGSTTVGMDGAIKILASERISPPEINQLLLPVRSQYEDWGTWEGDIDPYRGEKSPVSLTSYQTRLGEVLRRYEVKEPGIGGFGVIQITIESEVEPRRDIIVTVKFV